MDEMLEKLSSIIYKNLQEEFAIKHLSYNLIRTIRIAKGLNDIQIHIPAEIYDIGEYKKNKIVRYTGTGSYASSLDEDSKNHTDYIDRVINKSIMEWLSLTGNTFNANIEFR